MAGLDEGSLTTGFSKKRIIGIILVAVILFSTFAFALTLFSTIFNTQRLDPNDNLANAPEEDPILTVPPLPWNLSDILDFFNALNQTPDVDLTEEEIEDLAEQYEDMIDGSIDDIDLSSMAALIGALLFSDEEVFRVYDYDDISSVSGNLWKYESFDEYTGTSWECTSPLSDYSFYSYSNYYSQHSGQDIYNISMPLSPEQVGYSSFIIPNLFPTPYIMSGSIDVPNINPGETRLMKTGFNSTTLTLDFTSTEDVNMSYELFGADLPTYNELNSSAVDADYTPESIKDRYLQLPPDISTYISANPYFESHYNNLDTIINDDDNAVVVASKIRTYLENNFYFGLEAMDNDPPADDEDTVEWFCEHQEGVWSDFVSAFCAFGRAFNLSCRYIDGYNSRFLEEVYDSIEGKNAIPIMYRNIYNWAEVYVPTAVDGTGKWAQLDVCENISPFNGSGPGPGFGDFNISVSTNFTDGYRNVGNVANISAKLTSENYSVSNRIIEFRDVTMDTTIGQAITDTNGSAWITVPIDNNQTIGAHLIVASYSLAYGSTNYTVTGSNTTINLELTNLTPTTVNVSQDPTFRVQGYLEDPNTIDNRRIAYANIFYYLFEKGSSIPIPLALSPVSNYTSTDGSIDQILTLNASLPSGEYELKADFNGSWVWSTDIYPYINDSSNRLDLNITEEEVYSVQFYMNDVEANNNTNPVITRGANLKLEAKLLNETGGPVPGEIIKFYNSSGNLIGQNITNLHGIARYSYKIKNYVPAGPNKLRAAYGSFQNSSYFVLNAPINFTLNSFPNPTSISKYDSYSSSTFNIQDHLLDDQNNPIKYGQFSVDMLDGGSETFYLSYEGGSYYSSSTGIIDIDHSVLDTTPSKNYTIRVSFDGIFDYPGAEPYFDLSTFSNFTSIKNGTSDLEVFDPYNVTILFRINGTATEPFYDDSTLPERYNKGDIIMFAVDISNYSGPVTSNTVRFYDVDQGNTLIESHTFNGNEIPKGHYNFTIDTNNAGWNAGAHQIRVSWGNMGVYNSTYIIINETATISLDQSEFSIQRGVDNFIISGDITDESDSLRGLEVGIHLYDTSNQDLSEYINYATGSQNITINNDGTFSFDISSIDMDLQQGPYKIRVEFNGTINLPGIFLNDYMVHFNSEFLNFNLTAGTEILQQDYYTLEYEDEYPNYWVDTDTLVVVGNLTWDNNTGISYKNINVTVKNLSGNIIANNIDQTDEFGGFNISLSIDDSWPTLRDNTEIWVEFNSNDFYYVISSTKQFS
ncbi:MAG: hypothetical protein EU547_01925 [Promethearchaeota archaeon]|nr:MAG: hypothetical protein EU547_01925 [Candidatus Lokiarchaeota archaeon]